MTMRVAIVNPVWDARAASPAATLDRFTTLTGWATAVSAAGAAVSVFQRFPAEAVERVGDIDYAFVADAGPPAPPRWWRGWTALSGAVAKADPDIVHINGVVFPEWLRACRARLPPRVKIVAQDHGGWHPVRASWASRRWVRRGLAELDGVLVSSKGHIAEWRAEHVVPRRVRMVDVMESSVDMHPVDYEIARGRTRTSGSPAVLCVGRLTKDKDPLTVLRGFSLLLHRHPAATLTCVFHDGALEPALRRAAQGDPLLKRAVRLIGAVPHCEMAAYYSAADFFVSGSHLEGSGYAAMEAMACGAAPVVTDIPSFRALSGHGRVGAIWKPGDAESLADALARVAAEPRVALRAQVRGRFAQALSWQAVGCRAVAIYRDLCKC
jgi:glycosyltransferase involved in cell wall biosynthesis